MTRLFSIGTAAVLAMVFSAVSLTSCSSTERVLPVGVVTATGSVLPITISLERRGTHALVIDGEERYYLEGGAVDLRSAEGKLVAVTGTVQANIDPKAPPLLSVRSLTALRAEEDRLVSLPALQLSLRVPSSWGQASSGAVVRFVLADGTPMLSIAREPLLGIPSGVPLFVGGKQAYRRTTAAGVDVAIPLGDGNALLLHSLSSSGIPSSDAAFVRILTSVQFASPSSAASSVALTGTGTAVASPCGGTAGLLCPAGFYCSITDLANNIGVCVKAGKK